MVCRAMLTYRNSYQFCHFIIFTNESSVSHAQQSLAFSEYIAEISKKGTIFDWASILDKHRYYCVNLTHIFYNFLITSAVSQPYNAMNFRI